MKTKVIDVASRVKEAPALLDVLKKVPELYVGKKVNGHDVTVTKSGLVGAACEFSVDAVVAFFSNGVNDKNADGRTVVDALKDYADVKL
ncbi:MAG: hypothetical protein ACKVRP_02325 [Bacteroidota bacterium]